jgi:hypothetical protein
MTHITAHLKNDTIGSGPDAIVTSVHDSRDAARAWLSDGDPRAEDEVVLPVSWAAGTSRRPHAGETLSTMREASGLVAVVLP